MCKADYALKGLHAPPPHRKISDLRCKAAVKRGKKKKEREKVAAVLAYIQLLLCGYTNTEYHLICSYLLWDLTVVSVGCSGAVLDGVP